MNNNKHGRGEELMKQGIKYEGMYEDNHKIQGKLTWPDGKVYIGPFVNSRPDGRGQSTNSQGQLQEAEWSNGRRVRFL